MKAPTKAFKRPLMVRKCGELVADCGQPTSGAESAPEAQAVAASSQPVPFTATVRFDTLGYCVSWRLNDAKYHVWTDENGNVKSILSDTTYPTLYKNSVAAYREPGYFDCRKLDARAKKNKDRIAQALAQVDLPAAKVAYEQQEAEKEAARQADAKARDAKERLEAAAHELLEALQEVASLDPDNFTISKLERIVELARAAILKATQP